MALHLIIRNLTSIPLELIKIERFPAEHIPRGGALTNVKGVLISYLNATEFATKELRPRECPASSTHDVSHPVEPFAICDTGLPAAEPRKEVIRLTFVAGGHQYQTDAPNPLSRSDTMRPLDGGKEEFTTVYLGRSGFLAVFSSTKLASWMGELDGDLTLSALSLPGTHNSPTCYVALPSVRCQVASVRKQLDNGVRFLDVRVSAENGSDKLTLVHSAFPVSLTGTKYFHDLLAECYAFLEENPSEALIMSVKREGTGRAGDRKMSRYLLDRYIKRSRARWLVSERIPRLDEVRGKILLVRRFVVDDDVKKECGGEFGVDGEVWPDNCSDGTCGGGTIRVQDFYEIDQSTNIEKKIHYSRAHLERAAEVARQHPSEESRAPTPAQFFVNFLSASNFFNAGCWPERIAAKVNPAMVEYLCTRHAVEGEGEKGLGVGDGATGIVVTDWVGAHGDWDLIRCIVGMNSRLIAKR